MNDFEIVYYIMLRYEDLWNRANLQYPYSRVCPYLETVYNAPICLSTL